MIGRRFIKLQQLQNEQLLLLLLTETAGRQAVTATGAATALAFYTTAFSRIPNATLDMLHRTQTSLGDAQKINWIASVIRRRRWSEEACCRPSHASVFILSPNLHDICRRPLLKSARPSASALLTVGPHPSSFVSPSLALASPSPFPQPVRSTPLATA